MRNLTKKNTPLFIAFINLTKAFDLIVIDGLFSVLLKIGSLLSFFNVIKYFHTNTRATIQHDVSVSD